MGMSRAKLFLLSGVAVIATQHVALSADYPAPPPPPQQYYPPQPIYQQQPVYQQPVYQQQPIYQPPPVVYQPPPPPVYVPPPVVYQPPPPPPPQIYVPPSPIVHQGGYQSSYQGSASICGANCGGWYLRGDIGMTNQKVDHLYNALYEGAQVSSINKGFDSGLLFGIGVGYEINKWLRADVTGEYRGKTNFRALDTYGGGAGTDDYYASKSEWLYLLNLYADLGTWWCLTPFVGVGLGAAKVNIFDFRDINVPTGGVAYGLDASKWNVAWAVHAGVAYEVSSNLKLELSYRYVRLGDGITGDLTTYQGTNNVKNPMEFKEITSQDVRLGFRWMFDCCDVAPPPPPVVYQPPVYQPPPLMRRG